MKPWIKPRLCGAASVLGAFGTAICCVGPLLFSALGLGSMTSLWILRNFVPYRNWFFAITLTFLGLGFYALYGRRHRATPFDKLALWASTVLVLSLVGYSLYVEGFRLF